MKWLRLYDEVIDDPKVQLLPGDTFKFWINFLCLANRGSDRGVVADSAANIAFLMRLPIDTVQSHIDTLKTSGLIEEINGSLTPHNWSGRQWKSDDVTARATRSRAKNNVARNDDATPDATLHATLKSSVSVSDLCNSETETTDTDTPQSPRGFDARFEMFWSAYPRKVAKDDARKRWKALRPDQETCDLMLKALDWQCRSESWTKDGGKFIPHPSTWLNQGRWKDEPPPALLPQPVTDPVADAKAERDRLQSGNWKDAYERRLYGMDDIARTRRINELTAVIEGAAA